MDDAECDFLTAVMVCEYLEKHVYVHLLCSGVPGVGGRLLEYAMSEIKKTIKCISSHCPPSPSRKTLPKTRLRRRRKQARRPCFYEAKMAT